eukprot:2754293-Pyramimonas_sp.AAC.1
MASSVSSSSQQPSARTSALMKGTPSPLIHCNPSRKLSSGSFHAARGSGSSRRPTRVEVVMLVWKALNFSSSA